jgi:hypothetical protein
VSGNGVFDGSDMIAAEFDQILDFTTDTATGSWSDLDPDGCSIAGFDPPPATPEPACALTSVSAP